MTQDSGTRPPGADSLSKEPASFRDPSSAVFYLDGRVLRGLRDSAIANWEAVSRLAFFQRLLADGRIVSTKPAPDELLAGLAPDERWGLVLEHERIPFLSYPYEWTFSMLQDAACLHLEILRAALDEGVTMKDGYAFNVQWKGTRPLFIDVPSFEPLEGGGPWAGYRQFCQTFLFPLMLQAHKRVSFQPFLRGELDGVEPNEMRRLFTRLDWPRRGVFRHVYLQAAMQRRLASASTNAVAADLHKAGFNDEITRALVLKLLKLVRALNWNAKVSDWSTYQDVCTYSADEQASKISFVRTALETKPRKTVWDLGCNDGTYSRLAAEHATYVIAVDADHLVVDRLYRALREEENTRILPLVLNLLDPSPSRGWRGKERRSFTERGRPDLILCLALVHHLALVGNVPLAEIVEWLRSFQAEVVIEFADRHDPMVARLLANKPASTHPDYGIEAFRQLLLNSFELCSSISLQGGGRTIFYAIPRA